MGREKIAVGEAHRRRWLDPRGDKRPAVWAVYPDRLDDSHRVSQLLELEMESLLVVPDVRRRQPPRQIVRIVQCQVDDLKALRAWKTVADLSQQYDPHGRHHIVGRIPHPANLGQSSARHAMVVTGYSGQNEISSPSSGARGAGQRRTVQRPGQPRRDWLREGKVRILCNTAPSGSPIYRTPTAIELAPSEADRALFRLYAVKFNMARPLMLPPEVPADRGGVARGIRRDHERPPISKKRNASVSTSIRSAWRGEVIARLIEQVQATPQDAVDRLQRRWRGPKHGSQESSP